LRICSDTRMRLSLNDIDLDDRYFKISRDYIDEGLRSSIRDFGVLDPPVVVREPDRLRVVFGFNRLRILKELGHDATPAVVLPGIDAEWYVRSVLLKCHRNEAGPVGRLKILHILRNTFDGGADLIAHAAKNGLHIPEYFINSESLLTAAMNLPQPLKRYLDHKDIPHKIIRELTELAPDAIDMISRWLEYAPIRVNIFKSLIGMLPDIYDRAEGAGTLQNIAPDEAGGIQRWDEYLFGRIYRLRYPSYSSLKMKADEIVRRYSSEGIRIEYPPYFEGDSISLTLSLRKQDDPEIIKKKIDGMDRGVLRELLDLL